MATPSLVHLCIDRIVPEQYEKQHEELHDNVVNKLAVVRSKKWVNGAELRVRFLDGSPFQRKTVEGYAHVWEQHANVKLRFVTAGETHIRISFVADPGSWSAVGTDALIASYFPNYQPTMNFGWLRDDTEDEEYRRVVLHEFGHALGAIHEHQNPKARLKWNKAAVYRIFSGPPNYWSKADIDHNILARYSALLTNSTHFDPDSIMLYPFPPELFLDNRGTQLNTDLSARDKAFMAEMYPRL